MFQSMNSGYFFHSFRALVRMMVVFLIPPPTVLKKNLQKILSSNFSSNCRLTLNLMVCLNLSAVKCELNVLVCCQSELSLVNGQTAFRAQQIVTLILSNLSCIYCYPDCPGCLVHLNSILGATSAI